MRRRFDYLLDIAAVTVTVVVGTIAFGRFLDSRAGHSLDGVPIVGSAIEGVRGAWGQVYDPTRHA